MKLDRVSPLAVPVMVLIGKENLPQGSVDDALLLEAGELGGRGDAGRGVAGVTGMVRSLIAGLALMAAVLMPASPRAETFNFVDDALSIETLVNEHYAYLDGCLAGTSR